MNIRGRFQTRLIYALYWTIGCILLGILIAPFVMSTPPEDHSTHTLHDHAKSHGKIEVDPENAPRVSIRVERDTMAGWNVFITVENFVFAPESVNQANTPSQGHAHLYLNDMKLTRLYGTAYHLAELPPGRHKVSVSLNANDHSDLLLRGIPITATVTIEQPND